MHSEQDFDEIAAWLNENVSKSSFITLPNQIDYL